MDAHLVRFRYIIDQQVHLVELNRDGRVNGQCVRQWGITYSVVYWYDGKRYEEWVYDHEIEPRPPDA